MAGDSTYRPGERVKVSGIYSVVPQAGTDSFEVTCVEGERFPPSRRDEHVHYELKYAATHAARHTRLDGDAQA
ncbi:hypothetical protein [Burkholderia gladioli]|uniref:hypothetical protein n=1 Tax=Burkholderia gladioli TaxID=28095 RepID=UPI0034DAF1B1